MAKSGSNQRKTIVDQAGSIVLALVLAIVVWVNAVYQADAPTEQPFETPIPIEILNTSSSLVLVESSTTNATLLLTAFASSWESLTASSFRATIDLAGLSEGVHTVPVHAECYDKTVSIKSTKPETVRVKLERLDRVAIQVSVEIMDQEDIPLGYAYDTPLLDTSFVRVEGPASAVQSVERVVAQVSLLGERNTIVRDVQPKALDENGNIVRNITLTPSIIQVTFDVEKKLNYREVAVRALTTGWPAAGYFVSSIEVAPAIVTVYGPPAVIAAMAGSVTTQEAVALTGATSTQSQYLQLALPDQVAVLPEKEGGRVDVLVTVGIEAVMGGTSIDVPLKARGLREGLISQLSEDSVQVFLNGPAVLFDDFQVALVSAYVDLSSLGVGQHQVMVLVDLLTAREPALSNVVLSGASPAFISVTIAEQPTPTPTATMTPTTTETPTPQMTATTTPQVTVNATPLSGGTPTGTALAPTLTPTPAP